MAPYILSLLIVGGSSALALKPSNQVMLLALNNEGIEVDAYDPFADSSEFENPEDEAQDIRFFKKGRFFTLGVYGGGRFFTQNMAYYLDSRTPNFGIFISFFLNLTSALQYSALFGSHRFQLEHPDIFPIRGHFDYYTHSLDFKYFFDKEKLIPFVAFFNPYIIIGFTVTIRPASFDDSKGLQKTLQGYGFRSGLGVEIHFSKRFYIGLQGDFNYTTFPDESTSIKAPNKNNPSQQLDTGIFLSGDMAHALFIIGVNF